MRSKLLILFIFAGIYASAQSVPNTADFYLSDVTAVTGGTTLNEAFTNSTDSYFDPAYKGVKDRLSNFRNYTVSIPCSNPQTFPGGNKYPAEISVNLGTSTGTVSLIYDPQLVPDRFTVVYGAAIVVDTQYRGDSRYDYGGANRTDFNSSLTGLVDPVGGYTYPSYINHPSDGYPRVLAAGSAFTFTKSSTNPFVTCLVYAPMTSTQWSFTISCPY